MHDRQATYDQVARALYKQGRPSLRGCNGSLCAYFAPDGARCAAGHLIPPEDWLGFGEGKKASELRATETGQADRSRPELADGVDPRPGYFFSRGYDPVLIDRLQHAHDDAVEGSDGTWLERWRMLMIEAAVGSGLSSEIFDRLDAAWGRA